MNGSLDPWKIITQSIISSPMFITSIRVWISFSVFISCIRTSEKKFLTFFDSRLEEHKSEIHSVVPNSLWPHGLYSPWNSPGQNTEVGSCSLLQGIFPTQRSKPGLPHCRRILYQLSCQGSPPRGLYHRIWSGKWGKSPCTLACSLSTRCASNCLPSSAFSFQHSLQAPGG